MIFRDWVRQNPNAAINELAQRAIEEHPELIVPVIVEEIEHIRRMGVREQESVAVTSFLKAMGSGGQGIGTRVNAKGEPVRLVLPSEPFALGNGLKVTWGEATIEQHKQRIGMLRAMMLGTQQTMKLHEGAVKSLKATGALCLNDLVEHVQASDDAPPVELVAAEA